MTTRVKFGIIILFSAIIFNYCKNHPKRPPKECIELNNKAVDYLMGGEIENKDYLNKSINFFKQSIACDSNYVLPYMGLSTAYDQAHNYKDELTMFNKVLRMTNNDPTIRVEKGMLFERMGKIDSANKMYQLSKIRYEEILKKNPNDFNAVNGLIDLTAITKGGDVAIKELDEQLQNHPDFASKLNYLYEFYKDFDRNSLVHRKTVEVSTGPLN